MVVIIPNYAVLVVVLMLVVYEEFAYCSAYFGSQENIELISSNVN